MKLSNHFVLALAISGLALGCQQTKNLDEMHDATVEMNQTTKRMADAVEKTNEHVTNTEVKITATNDSLGRMQTLTESLDQKMDTLNEVSAKTDELKAITSGLCQGSRQALSEQSRGPLLESMTYNSVTNADKIEHAAKYFKGFEYQAWGICGTLIQEEREILMESAAHEFMFAAQRYVTDRELPDVMAQAKLNSEGHVIQDKTNNDANFNSIAITLHMKNHLQELLLAKNKREVEESKGQVAVIPPVTMYSMLLESLALESKINSGTVAITDLKDYQKTILQNRDVAIRLLQARHNILAGAFLSKFQNQIDLMDKVRVVLEKIKDGLGGKVDVSVDRFNLVQIDELKTFLQASMETRGRLKAIGIQPKVDGTLKNVFAVLNPQSTEKGSPALTKARQELIAVIQASKAM